MRFSCEAPDLSLSAASHLAHAIALHGSMRASESPGHPGKNGRTCTCTHTCIGNCTGWYSGIRSQTMQTNITPPRFSCPLALPTHMASSETVAHPRLRAGTVFGHDTVRHTRGSETDTSAREGHTPLALTYTVKSSSRGLFTRVRTMGMKCEQASCCVASLFGTNPNSRGWLCKWTM